MYIDQQRNEKKNVHEQVLQNFVDSFRSNLCKQTSVDQHNTFRKKPVKGETFQEENSNISELHHSWVYFGKNTVRDFPLTRAIFPLPASLRVTPDYFLGTIPDSTILQTLQWAESNPQPWPC